MVPTEIFYKRDFLSLKMWFFILYLTFFWTHVLCSLNSTSTQLDELFKKKHTSAAGYKPWEELEEATSRILEEVCKNCSKFSVYVGNMSEDMLMTAAGEKKVRNSYGLKGHGEATIELDAILCSVSLFRNEGASEESDEFFLADGDEPKSAFQFTLHGKEITLTRKFTDIWPKKQYVLQ